MDKREFTGPIYTQIEEAVEFVLRNIRLGATIDGLVRKEKYELPPEAIREMIINAHCHRNLMDESCIQIAIYHLKLSIGYVTINNINTTNGYKYTHKPDL